MSDDLRSLYQEMILDHHKNPRNRGVPARHNHHADGYNPLCGDKVTIYLLIEGDKIADVGFEGSGCAICMASTSVMTEVLRGKSLAEVETLFGRFHDLVTAPKDVEVDEASLGKLAIFSGVKEYPIRVKCATLPWHTLQAAIENEEDTISTE